MSDSLPSSASDDAPPGPRPLPAAQDAHSPTWTPAELEWDPFRAKGSKQQGRGRRRKEGMPKCQVTGCLADLSILKAYHQRYKICELHLKAEHVVCDGAKRRFCQQCGRFHELSAFAPGTRSCRERLERHNARRRKPNVVRKEEGQDGQGEEEEAAATAGAPPSNADTAGAQAEGRSPATVGTGSGVVAMALDATSCMSRIHRRPCRARARRPATTQQPAPACAHVHRGRRWE
jgi:hypothetical protein